jgi:2-oxoglutarate ferredoxin oxidoreductase subunit beta
VLKAAAAHKGSTYVEIYQNCPVFNDGAYEYVTEKSVKADAQLRMEHGKPLLFGKDNKKGIRLNAGTMDLEVVTVGENGIAEKDVLVHDAHRDDPTLAFMLANMATRPGFPTPIGVFRDVSRPTVEELTWQMIDGAKAKKGGTSLRDLLAGGDTWTVGQ